MTTFDRARIALFGVATTLAGALTAERPDDRAWGIFLGLLGFGIVLAASAIPRS